MATYIKRKKEVHDKLDNAVNRMTGREITSKKDQQEIRDAVNKCYYLYEKTLQEAIAFLSDDTKTAEQQRERWENHFHSRESQHIEMLTASIKNKPVTLFTNVIVEAITQDSVFYLRLSNMLLPDIMKGKLLEYKKEFEEEKESLLDKWEKLLADNENINSSIDNISEQLRKVYEEGLKKVDTAHTKLKEALPAHLKIIQAAKSAGFFAIPYSIRLELDAIRETLTHFKVTSQDLAYRFDQLYRSEDSVAVIMFGNTRKSVKEFLEKTNLDKAQKDYIEAEKHAIESAKNMLTTAQQEDAGLFIKEATDRTKITMQLFTNAYNSFIDSFKEIFIGPVGDRTVNDLINKERWDWAKNEYQNINIQTELKKIYDDSREWVDLDMYELDDETKYEVEEALRKERETLEIALKQAGDPGMLDSLKLYFTLIKDLISSKIKST